MHTFKVAVYDVPGAKPRETRWAQNENIMMRFPLHTSETHYDLIFLGHLLIYDLPLPGDCTWRKSRRRWGKSY